MGVVYEKINGVGASKDTYYKQEEYKFYISRYLHNQKYMAQRYKWMKNFFLIDCTAGPGIYNEIYKNKYMGPGGPIIALQAAHAENSQKGPKIQLVSFFIENSNGTTIKSLYKTVDLYSSITEGTLVKVIPGDCRTELPRIIDRLITYKYPPTGLIYMDLNPESKDRSFDRDSVFHFICNEAIRIPKIDWLITYAAGPRKRGYAVYGTTTRLGDHIEKLKEVKNYITIQKFGRTSMQFTFINASNKPLPQSPSRGIYRVHPKPTKEGKELLNFLHFSKKELQYKRITV